LHDERSSETSRLGADDTESVAAIIAAGGTLPRQVGRPLRIGAVNNPMSGRNLKKGALQTVLDVLSAHPEVKRHAVETLADIRAAAVQLCRDGVEVIAVNGGDGTVQAVMTGIFGEPHPGPLPLLLVLPGGTTNMTALDIPVPKEAPAQTLERFLTAAKRGHLPATVVQRPVIRMQRGNDPALFGMYFGAGAVYHGVNFCRRYVHKVGLKGEIGPGLAMFVFIVRGMFGERSKLLPPLNTTARLDDMILGPKEYFGLMSSTLEHLFLGIRPFWGKGPGPLKFMAVAEGTTHVLRAAPSILRGRPNEYVRPENGYESYNASVIELNIDSGFTLDGELFDADPKVPVHLDGRYTASFLRVDKG
jgi:hypothetical protein